MTDYRIVKISTNNPKVIDSLDVLKTSSFFTSIGSHKEIEFLNLLLLGGWVLVSVTASVNDFRTYYFKKV
jgi:hypothetical protein